MLRRETLLAESMQLKDDIGNFITDYHEPLDGDVWESLEKECDYIRQDLELLSTDALTEIGLDIIEQRNQRTKLYFTDCKQNLLEYLAERDTISAK